MGVVELFTYAINAIRVWLPVAGLLLEDARQYTITLLLQEINKNYYRKYDVVYLPQDFINNSNLGFGFINFLDHMYLVMFYEEFVGKKWNCFNSNKRWFHKM